MTRARSFFRCVLRPPVLSARKTSRFHAQGGLYFTRIKGGGVVVGLPGASVQAEAGEASVVLDAATWASVVASMTAVGENSDTFARALCLHGGMKEHKG